MGVSHVSNRCRDDGKHRQSESDHLLCANRSAHSRTAVSNLFHSQSFVKKKKKKDRNEVLLSLFPSLLHYDRSNLLTLCLSSFFFFHSNISAGSSSDTFACLAPLDFYGQFVLNVILPFAIIVFLPINYFISMGVSELACRYWPPEAIDEENPVSKKKKKRARATLTFFSRKKHLYLRSFVSSAVHRRGNRFTCAPSAQFYSSTTHLSPTQVNNRN